MAFDPLPQTLLIGRIHMKRRLCAALAVVAVFAAGCGTKTSGPAKRDEIPAVKLERGTHKLAVPALPEGEPYLTQTIPGFGRLAFYPAEDTGLCAWFEYADDRSARVAQLELPLPEGEWSGARAVCAVGADAECEIFAELTGNDGVKYTSYTNAGGGIRFANSGVLDALPERASARTGQTASEPEAFAGPELPEGEPYLLCAATSAAALYFYEEEGAEPCAWYMRELEKDRLIQRLSLPLPEGEWDGFRVLSVSSDSSGACEIYAELERDGAKRYTVYDNLRHLYDVSDGGFLCFEDNGVFDSLPAGGGSSASGDGAIPAFDEQAASDAAMKRAEAGDDAELLTLYKKFLLGEISAVDAGSGRELSLSGVAGSTKPARAVRYFSLSDLDGDGARELILFSSVGGSYDYVILTGCNGALTASCGLRDIFVRPKADGSFDTPDGVCRAAFEAGRFVCGEELALAAPESGTCFVGGVSVSEEEYAAFRRTQESKPGLPWVIFSRENVTAVLG